MSKIAVIYARYSPGPDQTESSIEGQLKEIYAFAKREGYNVIEEYIDRAQSATTDNRVAFQRMIEDSHKKHFSYILVYQLDRFARNRYDSAINKAKLKKNGVRVISARENISDDASGNFLEGVLESMAEYYSTELGQKIKRSMGLNAEKGLSTGGGIALGYKLVRVNPADKKSKKTFAIDEENAQLVRRIFQMYADGITVTEIDVYFLPFEQWLGFLLSFSDFRLGFCFRLPPPLRPIIYISRKIVKP